MAKWLDLRWRYREKAKTSPCDASPRMYGGLSQPEQFEEVVDEGGNREKGFRAELLLCERMFTPGFPLFLQMALREGSQRNRCPSIKDSATMEMYIPGATVLHELMHWSQFRIIQDQSQEPDGPWNGVFVDDWNRVQAAGAEQVDGYGMLPIKYERDED